MTLTFILVVAAVLGCNPRPAAQQPATAPVALTAPGTSDAVVDLLERLERAQGAIRDLHAEINYRLHDPIVGRNERRIGTLVYESRGDEGHRLGILLETLIIGQRMEQRRKDFIFDGGWLIEVDHEAKFFQKRQIVPPGQIFDPFKLGEGPFPLPIGQRADDILARFDVKLLDRPTDDALARRLEGTSTEGLLLEPKPATELAKKFSRLEIFYDAPTLLPLTIDALAPNGTRKIVILSNLKLNEGIDPALLIVEEPDPAQWAIDVRPWQ